MGIRGGSKVSTPPGRQLEELVARLERAVAGTAVIVSSPEFIPDIDTGEPREVDVALRTTVGSASILIIIECRDRSRSQDVRWVEELAEKRRSVGAQKAIAVSSARGFTSNAIKKAGRLGVELRTVNGISRDTLARWFPYSALAAVRRNVLPKVWDFHFATASVDGEGSSELTTLEIDSAERVLELDGHHFSLHDLTRGITPKVVEVVEREDPTSAHLQVLAAANPPAAGTWTTDVMIRFRIRGLQMIRPSALLQVDRIDLAASVQTEFSMLTISGGREYANGESSNPAIAAAFDLHDKGSILPGRIELVVIKETQQFSVANVASDGTSAVLHTGSLRVIAPTR